MSFASPTTKITAQATSASAPRYLPSCASFSCKGVCVSDSSARRLAILPISVSIPVAVTTATAVPYVMLHPEKSIFERSPSGAFSSTAASASLSEGTDSPVSADSSLFSRTARRIRASAGMKSPASSRRISPGTSSAASMTISLPSRITRACGADIFFSASRAFSALLSCNIPMTALQTTMARMRAGSKNPLGSPSTHATTNDTMAAAIRMRIIASLNCSKNRCAFVFFFFSRSLFCPYLVRRLAASADERPVVWSVSSAESTSSREPT